MIHCPKCNTQNPDGSLNCKVAMCMEPFGSLMPPPSPSPTPAPQPPVPGPSPRAKSILRVIRGTGRGQEFQLEARQDGEEFLLGRLDPAVGAIPEVDLSAIDGEYVHRKHAVLRWIASTNSWEVSHLGGVNGTFVGDSSSCPRLPDNHPQSLVDGQMVVIGQVVMEFHLA